MLEHLLAILAAKLPRARDTIVIERMRGTTRMTDELHDVLPPTETHSGDALVGPSIRVALGSVSPLVPEQIR
jgi:hypothetical protein